MDNEWKLGPEDFGPFWPYMAQESVTDICWNGSALWIDDIEKGRYKAENTDGITEEFAEKFAKRAANYARKNFNRYDPLLETQMGLFRISIVHEQTAHTGISIAIRRTSDKCRLTEDVCLSTGFCNREIWDFLPKIIKSGFSVIAGGLPGVGKTEFLKMMSQYIPPYERAIVIEDSPEFHYRVINPESDCTEWKIDEQFTYETALTASLRQRSDWNILAEVRGRETLFLMENFSSGLKVLTSTHLDDQSNLIPRLENMIGESVASTRIKNEVFLRGLVVCVIKRPIEEDGTSIHRYLDQIAFLSREDGKPTTTLVVDGGKIINRQLPPNVLKKFRQAGFEDPLNHNRLSEKKKEV